MLTLPTDVCGQENSAGTNVSPTCWPLPPAPAFTSWSDTKRELEPDGVPVNALYFLPFFPH